MVDLQLDEALAPPLMTLTAACSTHMHQGVVGLLPGVEQEVERPPVVSPLDSFRRRIRESAESFTRHS